MVSRTELFFSMVLAVLIALLFGVTLYFVHTGRENTKKPTTPAETPVKCEMVADVVGGLVLYECPLDNGVVCYVRNGEGGGVWCDRQEEK
jgi:hypothetical protein